MRRAIDRLPVSAAGLAALLALGCGDNAAPVTPPVVPPSGLPRELPFALTRPDEGTPLSPAAVQEFTRALTGAWRRAAVISWLRLVSYGVEKGNPEKQPYWSNFWNGSLYVKEGNRVTFFHTPNHSSDNATCRQSTMLVNVLLGQLLTGDPEMSLLVDEWSRGLRANQMALEWDARVPEADRYLMARYIIGGRDYEVDRGGGRVMAVDFSGWRHDEYGYFSDTIHVPDNPYWGDIWARSKRSKDDLGDVFRMAGFLPYGFGRLPHPEADRAIRDLRHSLEAFARDVVDHGYTIRTRDHDGTIFTPAEDFASYVMYGDEAECTARLAATLLGYGETRGIDCGDGIVDWYETVATATHLYNYDLIREYHLAAIIMSLTTRQDEAARLLLEGLGRRAAGEVGRQVPPDPDDGSSRQDKYDGSLAGHLVRYAVHGLPLTSREVAFVHEHYRRGIDVWNAWRYWDMWDPAIPDGTYYESWYDYYPDSHVYVEDMTNMLGYCGSPFRNPAGQEIVDCDLVRDPSRWGE